MKDLFQTDLYQVFGETRRLFQRLGAITYQLHTTNEITASMRAVLEFLHQQEPQTVPQIAREKSVSRQHIQGIVNDLLVRDFIELLDNPAHKRSPLIKMTTLGKQCFDEIKQQETYWCSQIEQHFSEADLKTTVKTLKALNRYFQSTDWQQIINSHS